MSSAYLQRVRRVATFEFLRFFKWKQELLTIGLMLGGFMLAILWPMIVAFFDSEQRIAVFDEGALPEIEKVEFVRLPPVQKDRIISSIGEDYDAVLDVEGFDMVLHVEKSASWQDSLREELSQWMQARKFDALELDDDAREFYHSDVEISMFYTSRADDEDAESAENERRGRSLITGGIVLLLFIGVMNGFALMMSSITQEKQTRVTEQLLTLLNPQEWMDGKILGVTMHSAKSMLLTGFLMFLLVNGVHMAFQGGFMQLPLSLLVFLNAIFFLLVGLLLVNSFLAGFAATIDDPNHSSRSVVMFIPMVPVFASFSIVGSADSGLATFLSIFPLTSFAAMPIRVAEVGVPWWQWLISVGLMLVTLYWARKLAARLFRYGITMYGKEPGWRDIWRVIINT
ncbi:ABC transporter permease [Aliidiomarina sedimenti]|uniref:ABC transporter permease n=1 Tax=Aliidiomarina sedimenti TaxID=1933879 RepID=A0ABY0C044_9GAMM|nr:ABC transporter permease [Aliidiomarina sedimenti]RUO30692.1 ABC transporter permease [Aliidiomarina sedimenti]